jgi:hypothetical protein
MHGEQRHHRQIGAMRRAGQPGLVRHLRHPKRAGEAAQITDVGLNDVDRLHLDHPAPVLQLAILFAAGDIDRQSIGDLFGLLVFPVGARLLDNG